MAETNIANVPRDQSIYEGSDDAGHISVNLLWTIASTYGAHNPRIGAAACLALALTECCLVRGTGKASLFTTARDLKILPIIIQVYYFSKEVLTSGSLPKYLPEQYARLPDLLYEPFVWDHASQVEWLQHQHWERMYQLSARGNAMAPTTLCMPISLFFEYENYDNIKFCDSIAQVIMTYNKNKNVYLGWKNAMAARSQFNPTTAADIRQGTRAHWIGQKNRLAEFRQLSGNAIVDCLEVMFREKKPAALAIYQDITKAAVIAHNEWVANGGYSIANNPDLGEGVAAEAARITAAFNGVEIPQVTAVSPRLQELRLALQNDWSEELRRAYNDLVNATVQGQIASLSFTVDDENWNNLQPQDRRLAIELLQLEQEAGLLTQTIANAELAPSTTLPTTPNAQATGGTLPSALDTAIIASGSAPTVRGRVTARPPSIRGPRGLARAPRGGLPPNSPVSDSRPPWRIPSTSQTSQNQSPTMHSSPALPRQARGRPRGSRAGNVGRGSQGQGASTDTDVI